MVVLDMDLLSLNVWVINTLELLGNNSKIKFCANPVTLQIQNIGEINECQGM